MPIQIVRNDITKIRCDAIVNAANNSLLGGGGVDGAIHRAAGRELLDECRTLGGCETGDAKMTGAYALPCKYVIHTVGPVWQGGGYGEETLLRSCYRRSLELAKEQSCESVAFPLISSGIYGYPKEQALQVAMDEISSFLFENDMLVYIVVFDKQNFRVSSKLVADIAEYIDEHYVDEHFIARSSMNMPMHGASVSAPFEPPKASEPGFFDKRNKSTKRTSRKDSASIEDRSASYGASGPVTAPGMMTDLSHLVDSVDESFSQMLLRKIDEKGMTDAECYKKANIDRKLFSKIRSNPYYKPGKPTALAFAIALELSPEETDDLLRKAGYALSHSNKFDIIIEYFINRREYNIFTINEALFEFDQPLLG